MLSSIVNGFGLGLGLIVAIGAQNAFVLRTGLLKKHVFLVCTICVISDATLIIAGVAGIGGIIVSIPGLETSMRWAGALFLIWLGAKSAYASWKGTGALSAGDAAGSAWQAAVTAFSLTWLNPHVYVDTVLLLGSLSAQFSSRFGFALGGVFASTMFFYALGYGARLLAPIMKRPSSWRVLDGMIALIMFSIASSLIWHA